MRQLRWCVLATHVPPSGGLGGMVRYTTELVAALGRRDDVEVVAVATAAAAPVLRRLVGESGRVHVVPSLPTVALSAYERRVLPLGDGLDVVHGVKHLVPRRTQALRVLTVHDMVALDRPEDFGLAKRHLLPGPYRRSIREADLLLNVSRATERRLLAHVPEVAPRSRVVPLATSSTLLRAQPWPVAALQGRRFVLVVGDTSPRKNLGVVVDAWPQVLAAVPDAVLAVAGPPGWRRTQYGQRYHDLVDVGAVVPLGRVSDAQLRWAYEHAALTLCPSLVEGFGLPVVEALDLGSPVAVSSDPALVEAAAGRAAAVVAPDDVAGWVAAVVSALDPAASRQAPATTTVRTWDDVARETVAAVQRRLA